MENLINAIFPPKCSVCAQNYGYICAQCLQKFKYLENSYCVACDKPSVLGETHSSCRKKGYPEAVLSSFYYEDGVRHCIKMSKYSLRQFSALKALTYEAAKHLSKSGFIENDFIIVSVPLSNKKRKMRGFNQADVISNIISRELRLKKGFKLVKRVKDTKSQYENSRKRRYENLENAFLADPAVLGKRILVVDDICTSGATFIKISEELYAKGALSVRCYSLAKKVKK